MASKPFFRPPAYNRREKMKGGSSSSHLTLEEYIDFFHGRRRLGFTVDQLNTIIFMHGFVRMHRRYKIDIVTAVERLDLTNPTRSTLNDAISCDAALALEEVEDDLRGIGWRDREVGSLRSLSASPPSLDVDRTDAELPRKRRRAPRGRRLVAGDRRIVLTVAAQAAPALGRE